MALPADFSKIFGSTATGGLTPIGDVNYAKGWEFVGSNPPTKNDFSYLQNLSDLKSQWLYSNKLQRTDPFGDIKSDGTVQEALENLGLGDLGTAAKKNVGTGAGQIPDMSAWTYSEPIGGAGWRIDPDGNIEQTGPVLITSVSGAVTVTFPIPFPSQCRFAMTGEIVESSAFVYMNQIIAKSNTAIVVVQYGQSSGGAFAPRNDFNTSFFAKGR